MRKEKKKTEGFEFGIRNVECGKKKENRSQRSDDKGYRMRNWECGIRNENDCG